MKALKWIWFRWFYRRFMKLAHRYDWHHMQPCYPDGDTMLHCHASLGRRRILHPATDEGRMSKEYKMGGGWGNTIKWTDVSAFDKPFNERSRFRVVGWKPRKPRKGDTIKAEFEKSWIWFQFLKVEPCGDPPDMFFADVAPFRQQAKSA
jgi:hypothetical protein